MVDTDRDIVRVRLPREIRVLAAAAFVIAIGYGLVAPALPTFARSFDVGVTAASAVISAFALFRLVFAPVSGRLVARVGELRTYLLGLGIVAVSTGACAFAAEYWQLLVFRSLGGIGSTMFTVASVSMLVRFAPPGMRGRASGLWATGFLLGNLTGPLVGGGLVTFGLRAPFVVYAVMLLAAMILTGLLLRGRAGVVPVDGRRCRRSRSAPHSGTRRTARPSRRRSPTAGPCSGCASRSSRCSSSRPSGARSRGAGSPCPSSPRATRRRSSWPDGSPTAAGAGPRC